MLVLLRRFLTHNWVLKLFSLLLATLMWFAISSENNLEISYIVPLSYQGLPRNTEITHETDKQVSLRLRGSESVLAELSNADISVTISLAGEEPGHKSILLSPTEHVVQKPFGVEVLRIEPNRVQFDLERTLTKRVPVNPIVEGSPADGFSLGAGPNPIRVMPAEVEVTGPESSIEPIQSLPTLTVRIDGARMPVEELVDLDIRDPLIRLPSLAPVEVVVDITENQATAVYPVPLDPALAERWEANTNFLEVRVKGPASQIETFDPANLYFTFDAANLPDDGLVIPRVVGLPPRFTFEIVPEALLVTPVD